MSVERVSCQLGDAELILETGKIGKQANGCVYAQWGGAAVIATICASSSVTEGQDFVPVTVEYNEKFYAAGKIPGGFVKREGRPKDKEILVGADFAGYPLKEAVVAHLKEKGWKVTDVGVQADSDPNDTDLMFHRVGLRVGSMISEGEFERALLFCGTGMGIHIAASKCPHVHAGVVESVPAAL